jgi:plastocyanin
VAQASFSNRTRCARRCASSQSSGIRVCAKGFQVRSFIVARSTVVVCLALGAALAHADDNKRSSVTASFGRGLNIPANTALNQAILPREIKVKAGGVVDFGVAGFHDIVIFKPGFKLDDLIVAGGGTLPSFPLNPLFVIQPDPGLPVNVPALADKVYYRGLNPAGGPPQTATTTNPSNASNRSEPVAFLEPGKYLVICNVRPHLENGMLAYVRVSK